MANSQRPLSTALFLLLSLCVPASLSEFTVVVPDPPPPAAGRPPPRTDPDEQRAVHEVMAATGNGWAASIPDVCREGWHGIECAADGAGVRHVVSLSFGALSDDTGFPTCDRRRSSAFLSPALSRLPYLRSLFFYRCFDGNPQPIPAFLGGLGPALRTLVLRENGLVGAVPAELGNLTNLRVLDLHGNRLSSWIPPSLASLAHLQLLDMGENSLRGAVPRLRSPLLKVLDLSGNQLGGPIPPTLNGCGGLIKLDLSRNRLGGRIPDSLGSLRELILLDLSRNRLAGPLPGSLRSLTSLRSLILSGNHMGGPAAAIPGDALAGMKDLNTLALSGMGLRGPIPESIGRIAGLRVLHLDGNDLEGAIPGSFRDLVELSELKLDGNRLEGPLPFDRKMLWRMGRKLSVSNNSGLCYDAAEGFLPGVAPCAAETTRARAPMAAAAAAGGGGEAASRGGAGERMVKHPAMSDGHGEHRYSGGASGAAHIGCSSGDLLHLLLPAMGVLLPALPLLGSPWL